MAPVSLRVAGILLPQPLLCCVPKRTEVELYLAHIWCSLVCLSTSPPEAQAQLLPLGSFLGMRNSKDQAKLTPKVTFTFYNPVSFIIVYAIMLSTRRMEQPVCCSRWSRLAEAGQTSFSLVSYFSDHFRKLSGLLECCCYCVHAVITWVLVELRGQL